MFVPVLAGVGAGAVLGGIIGGVTAWVSGENVWRGALRGAVIGAAGVLGGVAGASVAGTLGVGGTAGAVLGGALAGAGSDLAVQGVSLAFGWQDCYRPCETMGAAVLGGLGGILGGATRPAGVKVGQYLMKIERFRRGGGGLNIYAPPYKLRNTVFGLHWQVWRDYSTGQVMTGIRRLH